MSESEIHLIQLRLIAQGKMLEIVTHEDVQAAQLVVLAQIQKYQIFGSINMQLLQERIGREIQLLVSYRAEVYELQQRIFAYVEQLPTISRISQDTQARTFCENHIKACLAVFLQHQVQAYGSPIVQSKVWIFIVICAIIPCFMFTAAKIMQTSAIKACFQIAECSLSYAKIQVRCIKSWHKRENYLKNFCITLYQ